MKYIIMCGGHYKKWETPRHLLKVKGEAIVARTIRLLREAGVEDISISSDNPLFRGFGVPMITHDDYYVARKYDDMDGYWCNCFYPTDEPTCYIMGDVIFSPAAIRTIVDYEGRDIMLFGSKPPFAPEYPKPYVEPFAFKVWDTDHLKEACKKVKQMAETGAFYRKPIAWETWSVIVGGDPNMIDQSYVAINDYTCDIDNPEEIEKIIERVE